MADWTTISSLATAAGTLVLAAATFASVRSANRSARMAERSLLAGLRPLLGPSRLSDEEQKVEFSDDHLLKVGGGRAAVEATDEVVYFAMSLRNVGEGLAVLDQWHFETGRTTSQTRADHADLSEFRKLTRDIYIAPGDLGFWQGAFRDKADQNFQVAHAAATRNEAMTIELLYTDLEGGQRTISRFALIAHGDGGYLASTGRHWIIDGNEPREH